MPVSPVIAKHGTIKFKFLLGLYSVEAKNSNRLYYNKKPCVYFQQEVFPVKGKKKIATLEDSGSRKWWKNMKALMGLSNQGKRDLQGLANEKADGNTEVLTNIINDSLISVSSHLPKTDRIAPGFRNFRGTTK